MTEESVSRVLEHNWDDLTPLEQNDGPKPIATIAYTEDYATMMGYLRRVMSIEEYSERAFDLTTAVIDMNPAHYTLWEYRRRIIDGIENKKEDMQWLDNSTLEHSKNYQIWHHRQCIDSGDEDYYRHEHEIARNVIMEDSKHYHAWTHLQWLIRQKLGSVFTLEGELEFVNSQIDSDVHNNSAWNYRYFLLHDELRKNSQLVKAERDYVEDKISLAPQNEAPWNYIAAIYEKYRNAYLSSELKELCEKFGQGHGSPSVHALEILARLEKEDNNKHRAKELYDLLEELNGTRKGYWTYMKAGLL